MKATIVFATATVLAAAVTSQQPQTIDTQHSVMRVHVSKAGALSAFGHNHVIAAPIAAGKVDPGGKKVELQVDARRMTVEDPKASDKDRAEIQKTMLGPEVLDAARDSRIVFRSTSVAAAGANAWRVSGNLTLHGETRPITVDVKERDDHYIGQSVIKQSDFGIKPVRAAGGAVRTKDEVRVEFDIQLAR